MFKALDINTKEVIVTAATRQEAYEKAASLVGREGFCIRPVKEDTIVLPKDWCTSDGEWWRDDLRTADNESVNIVH